MSDLTKYDKNYLAIIRDKSGGLYDLNELPDTEKAERYFGDLARRGYVKIDDFARCGFEKVKGRFLSITEAGRGAISNDK